MRLFELFVDISIQGNDFIDDLDRASGHFDQFGSVVGGGILKLGKLVTTGLTAMGAGFAGLVGTALGLEADLEQSIGGIETLFGEDTAKKVIENASNAYKTAGLSANDYMETVTGVSAALIKSVGGDTAKAAEIADMAIRDMSDNANKMGTDIEQLKTAYAGFSKGQFELLDNLKLGYGGNKEQMQKLLDDAEKLSEQKFGVKADFSMENLDDIYTALHLVQENLGITGATAKEAETTISGSLALTKASFENLLSGVGTGEQFAESFTSLSNNVVTKLQEIIPRLTESMPQLIQDVIPIITPLFELLVPTIIDGGVALFNALVKGVSDKLPEALQLGEDIARDLLKGISDAVPALTPLTDGITALIDNFDKLLPVITGVVAGMLAWKVAMGIAGVIQAFTTAMNAGTLGTQAMNAAQQLLNKTMLNNPFVLITTLLVALGVALVTLFNTNEGFRTKVLEIWDKVKTVGTQVFDAIKKKLDEFGEKIKPIIDEWMPKLKVGFQMAFEAIKTIVGVAINAIKMHIEIVTTVLSGIINFVTSVFKGDWEGAWNAVKDTFTGVFDAIKKFLGDFPADMLKIGNDIVSGIWEGIKEKKDWLVTQISGFFDGVVDSIKTFFKISSPSGLMKDEVGAEIPAGVGLGIKENMTKAEKQALAMAKKTYDASKTWIENYKNDVDYLPEVELKMWLQLLEGHKAVSKERVEIEKNIAKLREEIGRAEFENSKKWIEKRTFFEQLTIEEQISAWERVNLRYAEGSAEREEIDRNIFTLKKQQIQEIETAEKDALEEQKRIQKEQEDLYNKQSEIVNKIVDAENKYNDAINSRTDAIMNSFGLFDKLQEKQEEEKITGEELVQNLKGQVVALKSWKEDLAKLSQMGISEELYQELASKGPQERDKIEALTKLTAPALEEYNKLWAEKTKEAREQSIIELSDMKTEMKTTIDGFLLELAETIGSDSIAVGKEIADKINQGLKENLKPATAKKEEAPDSVPLVQNMEALKTTVDTGFTDFNAIIVGKFGDMIAQAIALLEDMMDKVDTTLRVRGLEVGRTFMKAMGDALIMEKASLLAEALGVADAIMEIFNARARAKASGFGGGSNGITTATSTQANVETNMYFYGVEEKDTAFEAEQAVRRASWEAYA